MALLRWNAPSGRPLSKSKRAIFAKPLGEHQNESHEEVERDHPIAAHHANRRLTRPTVVKRNLRQDRNQANDCAGPHHGRRIGWQRRKQRCQSGCRILSRHLGKGRRLLPRIDIETCQRRQHAKRRSISLFSDRRIEKESNSDLCPNMETADVIVTCLMSSIGSARQQNAGHFRGAREIPVRALSLARMSKS